MAQRLGNVAVGTVLYLVETQEAEPVPYIVVHQGIPSSLYDTSCNGTWLLRQNILSNEIWSGGNNAFPPSIMSSFLPNTLLPLYEPEIQNAIKTVKIPYLVGNGNKTIKSGSDGYSCKLFLLGGYEVGFTTSASSFLPVDGAKLSYFESGTGTSVFSVK